MSRIQLARRPSSAQTRFERIDRDQRPLRTIGLGAAPGLHELRAAAGGVGKHPGLGNAIDLILHSRDNPVWNMDVIEQVRWGFQGPISPESVTQNFGARIDLFGSGLAPNGVDFVETTMAQTGQTQTYFIACYLGFHMEPTPMCWTARGNAWTVPETALAAPPSPDVFTQNDQANGALGTAISGGSQVMIPALLEYGWWQNYAMWHMARGYNLRWKIGQKTNIMDEVLRHTAYMPPSAQEGSASSSEVDIQQFVFDINSRYNQMGTSLNFMPIDFVRLGSLSVTSGETTVNVGDFTPSRDFDLVPATYGGMDLRSLLRNQSEFRKLTLPYVIRPGVPIGITLQENDSDQAEAMRSLLSITNQNTAATIPPVVGPAPNVNDTFTASGGNIMLERQLDTATNTSQAVPVERAIFKGGPWKLSLMIKGFEVPEDWYNLMSQNQDIKNVVMNACGVRFASQGS